MIEGYEFVYSLLHEGKIFYIGRCKNTVVRYQTHVSTARAEKTRTARFIATILDKGQIPFLKIIEYLPKDQAAALEPMLVTSITAGGQMLTNCSYVYTDRYYRMWPKNMPEAPTRIEMLKIIRYLEAEQIHWKKMQARVYSFSSPRQPFEK